MLLPHKDNDRKSCNKKVLGVVVIMVVVIVVADAIAEITIVVKIAVGILYKNKIGQV